MTEMIETDRLIIRKFTKEDLPWLIEMRVDPEVNRYLGGPAKQNPEAITKRMDFYLDCYDRLGFGACGMIWKATGEPCGWSGLAPLEDSGEIEVGYGMAKPFWRRGIGYECASAWLSYGFKHLGLERIVAVAEPENKGSWRIMEKCGMHFEKIGHFYGMDLLMYSVSKQEFSSLNK
jgi:ribosomal-protein-alanine N-acetyltransferase